MNMRKFAIVPLLLGAIGLAAFYPHTNNKEKEALILHAVLQYLENLHFEPQDIDNAFSQKVFDEYLETIDGGKRFLIQSEVEELTQYKSEIDDQINNRTFEFFDLSVELIENAVDRSESIFDEVIEYEYDFNKEESVELDGEKLPFAKDELELRDYWRKMIKHDLIGRIRTKTEEQKDSAEQMTLAEIKNDCLEDIDKNYTDWFKRMDKVRRSDRFENYINAITHVFDPHTDYFNPKEKEDFDIRMGGKLTGIGARLSPDGDYTKVVAIIPGGPAWKGKELEVNDLILTVTQEEGDPLDITGMRLDDVVQNIRGEVGTKVTLKVKKSDGTTEDITIERDEVIIDEGFARSLILDMPEKQNNIGYIKLPKFYSSFEGKDGNSCSIDVAKEIEKLKSQNVSGIILDLRNNGGGSLRDVVDMSGLFIEDGPIVQVKPKDKAAFVYDDKDAKMQYDGPLIVMVNQFSASASEILAAALQDYDRAIIVGATSTFGKGTVQRFADLDRAIRGESDLKPLGELKITMQKFYRVNGGSTQLNGVQPDIIFPDAYHYIETGEKEYDHALEWTEIDPVEYEAFDYAVPGKQEIIERSKDRIKTNEYFGHVLANAERLKASRDITYYPLDIDDYNSLMDSRKEEADRFEDLLEVEDNNIVASNIPEDLEYINSDESRVARNDDWMANVTKDAYLEETMLIMKDIIEMRTIKE